MNGLEALQEFKRHTPELIITDLAMPEMNGASVIERAQACQPGIKALLITGHPEALRTKDNFGNIVLPKPFKPAELSRRIAEILN